MSSGVLPRYLDKLRGHLASALNAINEFERLEQRDAWGVESSRAKRERALHDIERRVLAAADEIGAAPHELQLLRDVIAHLQEENAALLRQLHTPYAEEHRPA